MTSLGLSTRCYYRSNRLLKSATRFSWAVVNTLVLSCFVFLGAGLAHAHDGQPDGNTVVDGPGADLADDKAGPLHRYSLEQVNSQNVWVVSTPSGLNCRSEPSVRAPVVYGALSRFTQLVAYDLVGRRGVVNEGITWLRVLPRGPAQPEPCYVAAESRLIQAEYPDATLVGSLSQVPDDVTCSTFMPGSANRVRLVTASYVIYLCSSIRVALPVATIQGMIGFRRTMPSGQGPELKIQDPEFDERGAGQFLFRKDSYTYMIDLPSFRYPSSFLSVITPDGSGFDELILEWLD
jgi:hypothetical protein